MDDFAEWKMTGYFQDSITAVVAAAAAWVRGAQWNNGGFWVIVFALRLWSGRGLTEQVLSRCFHQCCFFFRFFSFLMMSLFFSVGFASLLWAISSPLSFLLEFLGKTKEWKARRSCSFTRSSSSRHSWHTLAWLVCAWKCLVHFKRPLPFPKWIRYF